MIKKSLFTALILFILYNLWCYFLPSQNNIAQNINQENVIKAQKFVYDTPQKKYSTVILGSSMSAEMPNTEFPATWYNLAFSGGTFATGLGIIKANPQLQPDTFLVEMNTWNRKENTGMVESLSNPILKNARKNLPALLDKNQPTSFLGNYILKNILNHKESLQDKEKIDTAIFNKMLLVRTEKNNKLKPEDTLKIQKQIKKMQNELLYFKDKGIKIFFYQTPIHPKLAESPKWQYGNAIIKRMCYQNPQTFTYIPADTSGYKYQTNDGHHMLPSSAQHFANYLYNWVKNSTQN